MLPEEPGRELEATPPAAAAVRIADADRERAIAFLRHHCTEGRITLDEFSDRVGVVYAATTVADLERVTADLPALERSPSAMPAVPTTRRARAVSWTVSMFSANQRKGRWRIDGETVAVSVMGGCLLDLRQAEVVGDEAVITAIAIMGGVDVVVPEGIEVVLEGIAFMGGKQARIKDVPVLPGSPLIRVRAFALMGGVHVRSRPAPGERKASRRPAIDDRRAERQQRHADRHQRHADRRGLDRLVDPPPPPPAPVQPPPSLLRGIDAVATDVRQEWPNLRAQVAPEGTVTIFFSDLEGFTSMTERLGDYSAQEILKAHYGLVRDQLVAHRGFEVKVHGDGFMVAFDSAARALRCARAIQQQQTAWNEANPQRPMKVRMGLHTGEAIRDADDFLGSTVNLASRIATAARGGEILVSSLLKELCASTGEFDFDSGHELELKGLSQPHRVFAVKWA
ncbi:MAG: eukaryotic-like serine/threonine-protein kinase [Actinomycetota bacterium]|jgi:class 3 adenylate cyclase|nr:eukaryotic-like serine/threonine-protein kinase [Actinomycetota bacterium]